MFERLDSDARAAVARAKEEAARAGKREVGTEHLLLGLLSRPGHASDALTAAGADAEDLRDQIAADDADAATAVTPDSPAPEAPDPLQASDDVPMTQHARHALELAVQATQRLKHRHVSSGHLLLGIIEQPHNGAVQALSVGGIHVGTLRADILQRMTSSAEIDAP
jgi:ATP-dependent Clp protease ATP-binding subunit ClpA